MTTLSKHAVGNTDLDVRSTSHAADKIDLEAKAPHPVFTNISANSAGDIFINGKLFVGQRNYINFQRDGKQKRRKKSVTVYECPFDLIPPGKIVKHHDNDQSNNSDSNLYLKDE